MNRKYIMKPFGIHRTKQGLRNGKCNYVICNIYGNFGSKFYTNSKISRTKIKMSWNPGNE